MDKQEKKMTYTVIDMFNLPDGNILVRIETPFGTEDIECSSWEEFEEIMRS